MGGEQTCFIHEAQRGTITLEAFITEQGSVKLALPKAFPGLKTLNSPPKKLGRLGNRSFTLQWLVFGVICFNPKKVCGAPAGSDKVILSVVEKCQSSVQDPRLSDWD